MAAHDPLLTLKPKAYNARVTNSMGGDWEDDIEAERERAAIEGRPYAVVASCDLRWDFGAPMPTILQWEHKAYLFFYLRGGDEDEVGAVIFEKFYCSVFDPPGEEGHELSGWEPYTPLQVRSSQWVSNEVGDDRGLSHFIFPFHDTTFECIAASFSASRVEGSMADAIRTAIARWR